jgi:DNA-binding CsgD family transcriptional regulator/tetratricopeptide (TPR) repeat protein
MKLVERDGYLEELAYRFQQSRNGIGHTQFLSGEAGIGKTSLINYFTNTIKDPAIIYTGACDSLFSPRPLGPLYDIAAQIGDHFFDLLTNEKNKAVIFASFIRELSSSSLPAIIIFEDLHWADEATIDFVKFMARRINRFKCLFLITYRHDEIHAQHPLKSVFGELQAGTFSRLTISRLSREAVDQLAREKGYASGEKVYSLTGGNPFYVSEILAGDSAEIPERVKDAVLSVFHSKDEKTRALWELLSILPSRIEFGVAEEIEHDFPQGIERCIQSGVIVSKPDYLSFKHELYRITIEDSLSVYRKRALHARIVKIMLANSALSGNVSQLVHHARFANDRELVAQLAPEVAQQSSSLGAHLEASRLYQIAIEHTEKIDASNVELVERHAYECYLTNQIHAGISSQEKVVSIWRESKVRLKEGDALRFLSRLWWFNGDRTKAMSLALKAIEILENGFPTRERAMAYSNMAQLNMLADNIEQTLHWGGKAIDLATRMEDKELLSHALNNVGSVLLKFPESEKEGEEKLNLSLSIALENGLHEHAARAYTNLSTMYVLNKRHEKAAAAFNEGLKYCEERDLNSWMYYMLSEKIKMLLETGDWSEAEKIASALLENSLHPAMIKISAMVTLARLKIRRGEFAGARSLIEEAKKLAKLTREAHRIVPILATELEFCWMNNERPDLDELTEAEHTLFPRKDNSWYYSELTYWKIKCGVSIAEDIHLLEPVARERDKDWEIAAEMWKQLNCVYEQALALAMGDEESQKKSLIILHGLGATSTHEMFKVKLKQLGVRNIPRGPRASTLENPAQLTLRQIEILKLLQDGSQNKEIADKLFISPKTVDHHISAILSKLEVNSRAKAVLEARRLGILK